MLRLARAALAPRSPRRRFGGGPRDRTRRRVDGFRGRSHGATRGGGTATRSLGASRRGQQPCGRRARSRGDAPGPRAAGGARAADLRLGGPGRDLPSPCAARRARPRTAGGSLCGRRPGERLPRPQHGPRRAHVHECQTRELSADHRDRGNRDARPRGADDGRRSPTPRPFGRTPRRKRDALRRRCARARPRPLIAPGSNGRIRGVFPVAMPARSRFLRNGSDGRRSVSHFPTRAAAAAVEGHGAGTGEHRLREHGKDSRA